MWGARGEREQRRRYPTRTKISCRAIRTHGYDPAFFGHYASVRFSSLLFSLLFNLSPNVNRNLDMLTTEESVTDVITEKLAAAPVKGAFVLRDSFGLLFFPFLFFSFFSFPHLPSSF